MENGRRVGRLLVVLSLCLAGEPVLCGPANLSPLRVSQATDGQDGNAFSVRPEISADGHRIAFVSMASNLVPRSFGNGIAVYLSDSSTRALTRISEGPEGAISTAADPSISADGRRVAFAGNGPGGSRQIYVADVTAGTLALLSKDQQGNAGNGDSATPMISRDGKVVALITSAKNLVSGCAETAASVVTVEVDSGEAICVSRGLDGAPADGPSSQPTVSSDGRVVAFSSAAANLVPGDVNGRSDVFVYDTQERTVSLVSRTKGALANGDSIQPSISDDGQRIAYLSSATNLVSGDTNGADDVFLWDRSTGLTVPVTWVRGRSANGFSAQPRISGDGRFVAFLSPARNLVVGQDNGRRKIYRWDSRRSSLMVVSVGFDGKQAAGDSFQPAISHDGTTIAFRSNAPNIIPSDKNFTDDVFVVAGLPSR